MTTPKTEHWCIRIEYESRSESVPVAVDFLGPDRGYFARKGTIGVLEAGMCGKVFVAGDSARAAVSVMARWLLIKSDDSLVSMHINPEQQG